MARGVRALDLGRGAYGKALARQREAAAALRTGESVQQLLLYAEHDPVITHGRASHLESHLLSTSHGLAEQGVELFEVERGGDVTYHGPGQIVCYPILDLKRFRQDLHWYLRCLEQVLIDALGRLDIPAFRAPPHTGVWVGEPPGPIPEAGGGAGGAASYERDAERIHRGAIRKIASIGVHASRWVTWHGYALNHTSESLSGFEWIVPCGIDGVQMTSIESEAGQVSRRDVILLLNQAFERTFETTVEWK